MRERLSQCVGLLSQHVGLLSQYVGRSPWGVTDVFAAYTRAYTL